MDVVDQLIAHPPSLHLDIGNTRFVNYGVSDELVRYLGRTVRAGMRTLETGAGVSTILFAARGAEHDCIMPDGGLVERLRAHGETNGIAFDRVRFHVGRSEDLLPGFEADGFELVLIDGRHAFPSPFIDWYYLAPRMKVGGVLIVDDTQLWTGRVLQEFLLEEPDWRFEHDLAARSAVFVKSADGGHNRRWDEQPYVVGQSRRLARWRRLRKWYRRLTGGMR